MKKVHIFGLIIIAIAVAVVISTAGNASSYVSFDEAHKMALAGKDVKVHVVGELKKTDKGKVIGIEPSEDKLSFSFILLDENNFEQKVYYKEPMPTDFTKSEKVVVIGKYNNELFIADKILLKCPSKYQENEIRANADS